MKNLLSAIILAVFIAIIVCPVSTTVYANDLSLYRGVYLSASGSDSEEVELTDSEKRRLLIQQALGIMSEPDYDPDKQKKIQLGTYVEEIEVIPPPPEPEIIEIPRSEKDLKRWSSARNMLFLVEDAYIQEPGEINTILGMGYQQGNFLNRWQSTDERELEASRLEGYLITHYGLFNPVELRMRVPVCLYQIYTISEVIDEDYTREEEHSANGLGSAEIGARLRLFSEDKDGFMPSVIVGGGLSLPTDSDGVSVYETGTGGYFSMHALKEFDDFAVSLYFRNLVVRGNRFTTHISTYLDSTAQVSEWIHEWEIYDIAYGAGITAYIDEGINLILECYYGLSFAGDRTYWVWDTDIENYVFKNTGLRNRVFYIAPGLEMDIGSGMAAGFSIFHKLSNSGYDYGVAIQLQKSF